MSKELKPFLYLGIGIVAVASSSILIRLCATHPIIIAFYRQLFCAVMIAPFALARPHKPVAGRDFFRLVLSGFFLAVHFATWITGLTMTTVARATLFVDLQPLWAAILGALLLKERLSKLEIAAVGIVTFGGILTVWPHLGTGSDSLIGDGLALTGGIAGAAYLLIGRAVRHRITWVRYMFSVYWLSAAWLLAWNLFTFRTLPRPLQSDLHWILLMALFPGILGHGLFNAAIRHLKAFVVNAGLLGEPVLATILAYWIFAEHPDSFFYAGAMIVLAGLLLLFSRQRGPTSDEEPTR